MVGATRVRSRRGRAIVRRDANGAAPTGICGEPRAAGHARGFGGAGSRRGLRIGLRAGGDAAGDHAPNTADRRAARGLRRAAFRRAGSRRKVAERTGPFPRRTDIIRNGNTAGAGGTGRGRPARKGAADLSLRSGDRAGSDCSRRSASGGAQDRVRQRGLSVRAGSGGERALPRRGAARGAGAVAARVRVLSHGRGLRGALGRRRGAEPGGASALLRGARGGARRDRAERPTSDSLPGGADAGGSRVAPVALAVPGAGGRSAARAARAGGSDPVGAGERADLGGVPFGLRGVLGSRARALQQRHHQERNARERGAAAGAGYALPGCLRVRSEPRPQHAAVQSLDTAGGRARERGRDACVWARGAVLRGRTQSSAAVSGPAHHLRGGARRGAGARVASGRRGRRVAKGTAASGRGDFWMGALERCTAWRSC